MAPSTTPQPTKLDLKLDHPKRLHAPGDSITGTLSGWDPSTSPTSSLHLILEGRSKSYITRKGTLTVRYKSRSPLLYQYTQLQPSAYNPTTQETRFTIPVPKSVAHDLSAVAQLKKDPDYWTHSWTPLPGFQHEGGYPLPPSMGMPSKMIADGSTKIYGRGYIRYTLTAVRSHVASTSTSNKVQAQPVKVTGAAQGAVYITTDRMGVDEVEWLKTQAAPTRCEKALTVSTKRLDPAVGDRRLSLRESLRGSFSSSTPTFGFKPVFTIPRVAVVGGNIRLGIRVEVVPPVQKGKAVAEVVLPPITLRLVTLRLKNIMGVRCAGFPKSGESHYVFGDDEPIQGSFSPKHVFHPRKDGKGYEAGGIELAFDIPSSTVPMFSTCNFMKSWYLKGEAHFECVSKRTEAEFKGPVDLFSKPRKRVGDGAGAGDVAGDMEGGMEDDQDAEDEGDDDDDVLEMAMTMLDGLNQGTNMLGLLADVLTS